MSAHGEHCPFLNRADARCAENFCLERLDHALEYCFDQYQLCPTYLDLLLERRARRGEAQVSEVQDAANPLIQVSISSRLREFANGIAAVAQKHLDERRLEQTQPPSGAQNLPAPPRF